MGQIVLHKRSVVSGKAPDSLEAGEFAINLADKVIYAGDVDKKVFELTRHYEEATSSTSGIMSSADKSNLDNLVGSSVDFATCVPIENVTDILED